MTRIYTVFDEALDRIRHIYKIGKEPVVSMSGGKDSTVLYEMFHIVAKELNRLPLKVMWLDQEAEWQGTVDYMTEIFSRPEVEPIWYQFPFDFTNSMSYNKNFLRVWDPDCSKDWIHQMSDISRKDNPTPFNRFHPIVGRLAYYAVPGKEVASIVGIRTAESRARRMAISFNTGNQDGITWCTKDTAGYATAYYPIYDFRFDDIWTAIAKNGWKYNRVYDQMFKIGTPKKNMRVSSLIHETSAVHSIKMLQEVEIDTYNRFIRRVYGTSCFAHFEDGLSKASLPFAFANWKEYRDYLLVNLVQEKYWEAFLKRWWNQNSDEWYQVHIDEIAVNDIDGTINQNHTLGIKAGDKDNKNRYALKMSKEMYEQRAAKQS